MKILIDALSAFKQEIIGRFDKVEKRFDKLEKRMEGFDIHLVEVEKNLTRRIDLLGKQVAILDDDAPSGEEFDELKRRVEIIESKIYLGS